MFKLSFVFLTLVVLASAQYIPQQPLPGYKGFNPYGNGGGGKSTGKKPQPTPKPTTKPTPATTTTRAPLPTFAPFTQSPSTKSTCQYTFQVPDPKGACAGTSAALTQKLDQVKHELDQTRFQVG